MWSKLDVSASSATSGTYGGVTMKQFNLITRLIHGQDALTVWQVVPIDAFEELMLLQVSRTILPEPVLLLTTQPVNIKDLLM